MLWFWPSYGKLDELPTGVGSGVVREPFFVGTVRLPLGSDEGI